MKWNIFKRLDALEALVTTQQQTITALSNKYFLNVLPEELEKIAIQKKKKSEYYQRNKEKLLAQRRSKKNTEIQKEKHRAYAKAYYLKKKAALISSKEDIS